MLSIFVFVFIIYILLFHIYRQLEHPNIIKLLDLQAPNLHIPSNYQLSDKRLQHQDNTTDTSKWLNKNSLNELYFSFEYLETDMYRLLSSPQFLTTPHIAYFMYQLLLGLNFLHSAHVIHRDLKPANILLRENCSLKICDFGLSRVVAPVIPVDIGNNARLRAASITRQLSVDSVESRANLSNICPPTDNGSYPMDSEVYDVGSSGVDVGVGTPVRLKRSLTLHVVTRWYRAPELILLQDYTSAVDMWSVGKFFIAVLPYIND